MSKESSETNPGASTPAGHHGFFSFSNCAALAALIISVIALTVAVCSGAKHEGRGHEEWGKHKRYGGPMMQQGPHGFREGEPPGQDGSPGTRDRFRMDEPSPRGGEESYPRSEGDSPEFGGQPGSPGEGTGSQ